MSSNPPTSPPSAGASRKLSIVLGVTLGGIGLLIIASIIIFTTRMKRRRNVRELDYVSSSHGSVVDRLHPASKITPFGRPRSEGPRFSHIPGSNMRVAIRRPDGAWDFSRPPSSFTPLGVNELDLSPSSSTPLHSFRSKEKELKLSKDAWKYVETAVPSPPPAYDQGSGGYINHMT